MDSFTFNKIAGAVIAALLVLFGAKKISHIIFAEHAPEKAGYEIAVASVADTGKKSTKEPAKVIPIAELLASANGERGAKLIKKCVACHTLEKGGKNKVGPNLWSIVGRDVASIGGFKYSKALAAKAGAWSYDELNCFLADPKKCVPDTKMALKTKSAKDRADLIMYLRALSEKPLPLPEKAAN